MSFVQKSHSSVTAELNFTANSIFLINTFRCKDSKPEKLQGSAHLTGQGKQKQKKDQNLSHRDSQDASHKCMWTTGQMSRYLKQDGN